MYAPDGVKYPKWRSSVSNNSTDNRKKFATSVNNDVVSSVVISNFSGANIWMFVEIEIQMVSLATLLQRDS